MLQHSLLHLSFQIPQRVKKKRRVLFKYNNCNTDTVVMIQNTEIYKCKSVEPFELADREGNGSHEH